MRLSDLPWGMIAKGTAGALAAVGIFGGGYLTATPSKSEAAPTKLTCDETTIVVRPKVIIEGREVKPK